MSKHFFCGLPAVMPLQDRLCKWPDPKITWTMLSWSEKLSTVDQKEAFNLAWGWWAEVCGIRPEYSSNPKTAQVLISFSGIDGGSGTLAWSELPCGGTDRLRQMYDTAERWVVSESPQSGVIDLARVACHEIGHVIGIPHLAAGNLLAPYYSSEIRKPQNGDIREAQLRYGRPSPVPIPPEQPNPGGNVDDREKMRRRLEFVLLILGGLAKATPPEWDDDLVGMAKNLVAQDWVVDVMVYLVNKFGKASTPITADQFADAVQEFRLKAK